MDCIAAILGRRSCRSFKNQKVEEHIVWDWQSYGKEVLDYSCCLDERFKYMIAPSISVPPRIALADILSFIRRIPAKYATTGSMVLKIAALLAPIYLIPLAKNTAATYMQMKASRKMYKACIPVCGRRGSLSAIHRHTLIIMGGISA